MRRFFQGFARRAPSGRGVIDFATSTGMGKFQTKSEREERLKKIVSEELHKPQSQIYSHSRFIEDLGADEKDTVELTMRVESEFSVTINDYDMGRIKTFGDLKRFLNSKK